MKLSAYAVGFAMLCAFSIAGAGQMPVNAKSARIEMGGVSFAVPKGWTSEPVSGGVLLLAPFPEKGWHANIYVAHRTDRHNRPVERVIAELVPNLAAQKQGFKELSRSLEEHPAGLQLASVEYLNESDKTPLREREIVIALPGTERLFIVLSSEAGLFDKYQPTFSGFLASMSKQ